MTRHVALMFGLVLGLTPLSTAGVPGPWVLWSRDTHFRENQPARHWRTDAWVARGGPFDTRDECDRRKDESLDSAARTLGDGYRVTAQLDHALVARRGDGTSGLRRRYVCLPVSAAPPR